MSLFIEYREKKILNISYTCNNMKQIVYYIWKIEIKLFRVKISNKNKKK